MRFESWQVFKLVYAANISRGGMLVVLPGTPKTGDSLVVELTLPHGRAIRLSAVVRHVRQEEPPVGRSERGAASAGAVAGVEFVDLDQGMKGLLEQLISDRMREQAAAAVGDGGAAAGNEPRRGRYAAAGTSLRERLMRAFSR